MFGLIGKFLKKRRIKKLLKRACMNEFSYNTRIMVATPDNDERRVGVGGSYDSMWGDCVSISVMLDPESRQWFPIHFSPARARLIAEYLNEQADYIEKVEPTSIEIDKPVEKRR